MISHFNAIMISLTITMLLVLAYSVFTNNSIFEANSQHENSFSKRWCLRPILLKHEKRNRSRCSTEKIWRNKKWSFLMNLITCSGHKLCAVLRRDCFAIEIFVGTIYSFNTYFYSRNQINDLYKDAKIQESSRVR